MANIIVIDHDVKIQRQVVSFIRELDKTHHIRTFNRGDEFLKKYTSTPLPTEDSQKTDHQEDDEAQNLPHIDFIVFQANSVSTKRIRTWIEETNGYLKDYRLMPSGKKTKFIALRYEDDGTSEYELFHPQLIDIFVLPLDRLLVMQKLQILLGLPEKISPSYLFTQQVELPIEVSKKSTIEGLSETAIIIRNPVPLKAEVNSHIYFTIPEGMPYAGTVFNIYGKTFHSEPHPELPNCYLVYISFFGMSRDLSTKLRAILNRVPRYQYFKNSEIDDFQFDPRNIFVTEDQKKIRNIVVLDLERQQAVTTAETLKREIGNIECFACNSYFRFSEAHFVSDSDREMGQPARQSDFPAPEVVFTITSENWDLKIPPSNLAATDEFLGHNVATLFAQPDAWRKLFEDLYHANILSETLRAAELEKMLKTEIEAQHANGQSLVLNLEATQKSDGLELIFRPPMAQSERGKFKTPLSRIDAIVINSHLIPTDVEGWLERLTEKIKDSRLNTRIPKIIIMADSNETDLSPIRCLNLPFYAYIDYPINPKQLVFSVTQATGSTFSRYTVSNLRYADLRIPVFLAKHALLEGLSEFGASIRLAQPLADGALLYLHGAIFDSAPGGHLAARFYLTEPHPENKNYFKCHFLYYAITDAFLKYTRNYIREQYTSGKTEAAP